MDFFKKQATGSAVTSQRVVPWAEKYRPRSLDDVAAQEKIIETLKTTLAAQNLPHMLFYGPPGTGKTSTVLALARDLFGPELSKTRVLELNASDERGISVVRDKIKTFAQGVVSNPSAADAAKYPCPNFKIIVLDEADSMTQDAQAALRRIMEINSKFTRFCLVCNYVTRIIDPVASRCSKFRFASLSASNGLDRLEYICKQEGVNAPKEALERLLDSSNGDLRRAITLLQSSRGLVTQDHPLTEEMVDEISGQVPAATVDQFVDAVVNDNVPMDQLRELTVNIVHDGWSVGQLLDQSVDKILAKPLSDSQRARISLVFSAMDRSLVDGCDEGITLLDMAYKVAGIAR